jgi:AraC-like DNA-binding protein
MESSFYSPGVQLLKCDRAELGRWWERNAFGAPYWRLYWNPQPGARVRWAGEQVPLEPSRFVIIPPETPFTGASPRPVRHLYAHFLAQAPYDTVQPGLYSFPADGVLRQMAGELLAEMPEGDGTRWASLVALTLIHAALCHIPASAIRPSPSDARIVQALATMDASLREPLTNAQLAQRAGMSTNAFIRLFRQVAGTTPQEAYTRKRIDRTCMQLHFTQMKLEQIAQEAGFCDRYHFSRTFKRLRGTSPAAFRRQTGRGSDPG